MNGWSGGDGSGRRTASTMDFLLIEMKTVVRLDYNNRY